MVEMIWTARARLVTSMVLAFGVIWALSPLDPQPVVGQMLATATPAVSFPSKPDSVALPAGLQVGLPTPVELPVRAPVTPTRTPTPLVSRPAPRAGGTPPGLAGRLVVAGIAAFGGGASLLLKRPRE